MLCSLRLICRCQCGVVPHLVVLHYSFFFFFSSVLWCAASGNCISSSVRMPCASALYQRYTLLFCGLFNFIVVCPVLLMLCPILLLSLLHYFWCSVSCYG